MKSMNPLSLPEAARLAGLPYLTLWHAVVSGELPAERRGGRWYVYGKDAERLQRSLTSEATGIQLSPEGSKKPTTENG